MPRYEIQCSAELIYKINIEAQSDSDAQKFLDYLMDGVIEPEDADTAETLFDGITHGSCTTETLNPYVIDYDRRLEVVS